MTEPMSKQEALTVLREHAQFISLQGTWPDLSFYVGQVALGDDGTLIAQVAHAFRALSEDQLLTERATKHLVIHDLAVTNKTPGTNIKTHAVLNVADELYTSGIHVDNYFRLTSDIPGRGAGREVS